MLGAEPAATQASSAPQKTGACQRGTCILGCTCLLGKIVRAKTISRTRKSPKARWATCHPTHNMRLGLKDLQRRSSCRKLSFLDQERLGWRQWKLQIMQEQKPSHWSHAHETGTGSFREVSIPGPTYLLIEAAAAGGSYPIHSSSSLCSCRMPHLSRDTSNVT